MSTGGGTGYNPEPVHHKDSSDKSLMGKLKDAIMPNKHSSTRHEAGESRSMDQGHGLGQAGQRTTGEGEAYTSNSRENVQGRPQEGIANMHGTHYQDTMPSGTGMRHQGQDTSGGITDALKPNSSASGHSTSGQAVREMMDDAGNMAPTTGRKMGGGLGSDPGSAAFGR